VAIYLGVELSQVRKLRLLLRTTFSLDQPLGDAEDYVLGDTIEDAAFFRNVKESTTILLFSLNGSPH
jgi:DNA-directed RNA polymerase sigma subunit (sigma70/sigma32)